MKPSAGVAIVSADYLTSDLAKTSDKAKKLTIKTGKNVGSSPSVASLYRAIAEAEVQAEQAAADGLPLRPKPARILQNGE